MEHSESLKKNDFTKIITSLLLDVDDVDDMSYYEHFDQEQKDVIDNLLKIRELTQAISEGNLSHVVKGKGYLFGTIKSLQASLRNLTWQTKAIADGDFTQRVDFLGDFSTAFNEMTELLQHTVTDLKDANILLNEIFETIPDATVVTRLEDQKILTYNRAFLSMSGATPEDLDSGKVKSQDFYIDLKEREDLVRRIKQSGLVQNAEITFKNLLGQQRVCLVSASVIQVNQQQGVLSVIRDIDALKKIEHELSESEKRHRLLADNALDVIWTMDTQGRFTYVSPSVEKVRGYTPEEVKKQSMDELICKESQDLMINGLERVRQALTTGVRINDFRGEIKQPCRDGSHVWMETNITGLYDEKNHFFGLLGVSRDITQKKILAEELKRLSVTDNLTQLYNRMQLDQTLSSEIYRFERYQIPLSVLLIDIDYFKKVNDQKGHLVGDQVLIELAEILKTQTRQSDTVGRWGGEEFMVILPNTPLTQAVAMAEKIRLEVENHVFAKDLKITISLGVAEFEKGMTFDKLLQKADNMLYQAKEDGRNLVAYVK